MHIINYYYTGDITSSDYELEIYYDQNSNPKISLLQFHWNLSEKAENLLSIQFIVKFKITIEQQLDGNITTFFMENKSLTLNEPLKFNQWYLVIGRIITEDNDTWKPEPVYKYFKTKGM